MIIEDTILLGYEDVMKFRSRYPFSEFLNLSNNLSSLQRYSVVFEADTEEGYFDFLFETWISVCSQKFLTRLKTDPAFAESIRKKIEAP